MRLHSACGGAQCGGTTLALRISPPNDIQITGLLRQISKEKLVDADQKPIEFVTSETSSNSRVSNYVSLLLRVRRPFKASVSPSSFEHRSLQSSLSFRTFSNSASSSFIRSTRLCRHLRAARVLSLRFSTRDESTRLGLSSPWEVEGLDREVETGAGNGEIGD